MLRSSELPHPARKTRERVFDYTKNVRLQIAAAGRPFLLYLTPYSA
jgi:hypothetical protein